LATIEYAIEIFDSGGTFGPNLRLGEIWEARNLGWSRYDRVPGRAFFTLAHTDNLSSFGWAIVPLTTHVRFYRIVDGTATLVYTGVIVDYDSTGDDVIYQCLDYLALLSISRTGYKTLYPVKAIGTEIVSPEWTLAKNATSSPLGFITTGTIENPLGTDDVTVIKSNTQFGLLDQMRLQLFYDLSEMGRANTTHHVTFEIAPSTTPTFTFYKDKGTNVTFGFVLNGNVSDYRYLPNWTAYRNDLATVGSIATGGTGEIVKKDDTAAASKGRRQDVFTIQTLLGIVGATTEADQQQAVAQRMLKKALTLQPTLALSLMPGGTDLFNGWDICDKVLVEIENDADEFVGDRLRIVGVRAVYDDGGERPSVIVQPVAV
jgi:hypothetical protein